jgi:hypothetical protein
MNKQNKTLVIEFAQQRLFAKAQSDKCAFFVIASDRRERGNPFFCLFPMLVQLVWIAFGGSSGVAILVRKNTDADIELIQ